MSNIISETFDRRSLLSSTALGGAVGLAAASSIYATGVSAFATIPAIIFGAMPLSFGITFGLSHNMIDSRVTSGFIAAGLTTLALGNGAITTEGNVNNSVCVPFNQKTQEILDQYPNIWNDGELANLFSTEARQIIDVAYDEALQPLAIAPADASLDNSGVELPYSILPYQTLPPYNDNDQMCVRGVRDQFSHPMVNHSEVIADIQARFEEVLTTHVDYLKNPGPQ